MRLREILEGLRATGRAREEAGRELLATLQRMAQRPLRAGRSGVVVMLLESLGADECGNQLVSDARQEVVQQVAVKILEVYASGRVLRVHGEEEPVIHGYLKTMLANECLTRLRRSRREVAFEPERPVAASAAASDSEGAPVEGSQGAHRLTIVQPSSGLDADAVFTELRRVLTRVVEEGLIAGRPAEQAASIRRDFEDMWQLVTGGITAEDLLARERAAMDTAEAPSRKTLQDRVLQRHSRLRRKIEQAIAAMEDEGRLPPEQALLARHGLGVLYRCQKRGRAASKKALGTEE